MQRGYIFLEHGHPSKIFSVGIHPDIQLRNAAWTSSIDKQYRHAAWGHGQGAHGHTAWTYSNNKQHGHAAKIHDIGIDIQ